MQASVGQVEQVGCVGCIGRRSLYIYFVLGADEIVVSMVFASAETSVGRPGVPLGHPGEAVSKLVGLGGRTSRGSGGSAKRTGVINRRFPDCKPQ